MFQLLAAVSVFFIFISITSFCLKTHPAMRVPTVSVHSAAAAATSCPPGVNTTGVGPGAPPRPRPPPPTVTRCRDEPHAAFFYVDSVCNAWFAVEVVVRLATSPRPWRLLRSPPSRPRCCKQADTQCDKLTVAPAALASQPHRHDRHAVFLPRPRAQSPTGRQVRHRTHANRRRERRHTVLVVQATMLFCCHFLLYLRKHLCIAL